MNAIILAAGSGKRIREDVKDLPKSLLMVNGKPIIAYQIQALKQAGINDIIVITGAHSEKFEIVYGFGHREMYRDVADVLNNRKKPPVSFEDAMRTLTLLHGIYRSAELGTWVDLSESNQSVRLGRPDDDISALYHTPVP